MKIEQISSNQEVELYSFIVLLENGWQQHLLNFKYKVLKIIFGWLLINKIKLFCQK